MVMYLPLLSSPEEVNKCVKHWDWHIMLKLVAEASQMHASRLGPHWFYTVGHKKGANLFFSVTLAKINGF